MSRPQRRTIKRVKDQSLVESVAIPEESVIEISKNDSNIVDKGFYLDEKVTEGFKETIELSLKEVVTENIDAPLLSQADIQAIQLEYQEQLDRLKKENEKLRIEKGQFGANEQKVLTAIKSEVINQSTYRPIMSRTLFKGSYGMNEKYLSPAIDALLDKKIINRYPAKKNGQNTFSWEVL